MNVNRNEVERFGSSRAELDRQFEQMKVQLASEAEARRRAIEWPIEVNMLIRSLCHRSVDQEARIAALEARLMEREV